MTVRHPPQPDAPAFDIEALVLLMEKAFRIGRGAEVEMFLQQAKQLAATGRASMRPPFAGLNLAALAAQPLRRAEFAIEGAAPAAEVSLMAGKPGDGKTQFSLGVAAAMALGLGSYLGLQVISGPVIYYACEEPVRHLHWLLHHACRQLKADMAALNGKLHILNRRGELENHFGTFEHDGTFVPSATWERLVSTVEETGAKAMFIDNAAHVFIGNENDRSQVTRAMTVIAAEAERLQCAIILLAHPNKAGADYSGSTAWIASVRSQFVIERPADADDDDLRALRSGKSNYGPTGELVRFRWHDHAFVREEDLPSGIAAELRQVSRSTSANEAFLRCLAKVTEEGRNVSHTGASNYAPRVFSRMPIGRGYSVEEFAEAMERLLHNGTILAGQRVGQYDNRSPKMGLKLADEGAQLPAQSAHNQPHKVRSNGAQSPHNSAHAQPLSPTGIDGVAPMGWPPPSPDDLDWGNEGGEP